MEPSPESLPEYLYRVQYASSGTMYNREVGLEAGTTIQVCDWCPILRPSFKDAVVKHFEWHLREPSPFITLFSVREHAEKWALQREGEIKVLKIDARKLKDKKIHLFELNNLLKDLKLDTQSTIPRGAKTHKRKGFLALHHIPAECIEVVGRWIKLPPELDAMRRGIPAAVDEPVGAYAAQSTSETNTAQETETETASRSEASGPSDIDMKTLIAANDYMENRRWEAIVEYANAFQRALNINDERELEAHLYGMLKLAIDIEKRNPSARMFIRLMFTAMYSNTCLIAGLNKLYLPGRCSPVTIRGKLVQTENEIKLEIPRYTAV